MLKKQYLKKITGNAHNYDFFKFMTLLSDKYVTLYVLNN